MAALATRERSRCRWTSPRTGAVQGRIDERDHSPRSLRCERSWRPRRWRFSAPRRRRAVSAAEAGGSGARAMPVISAGPEEDVEASRGYEERLLEIVRGAGLRLVGLHSMGVVNTDPGCAAAPQRRGTVRRRGVLRVPATAQRTTDRDHHQLRRDRDPGDRRLRNAWAQDRTRHHGTEPRGVPRQRDSGRIRGEHP